MPSVITPSTSDPWLALSTIHSEAKGNCLLPAEQSSGQQARFHRVLENLDLGNFSEMDLHKNVSVRVVLFVAALATAAMGQSQNCNSHQDPAG